MELYKNVYQIQSLYGGRNLFQYFFNADQRVLLDTGIAETPENAIFPYLDKLKVKPEQLTLAITTHADMDHQGGNDAIKRHAPHTWLACGEADRELVEDPHTLYARRYNFLKEENNLAMDETPPPAAGKPRRMDITFSGGETIRLGEDWCLQTLHVPGHSRGHLAFYDARHKTAFVGDAIHGRGCPKATGELAIPVTYYNVEVYLSTLRYFEQWPIEVLYSGHWPVMRGEEVKDFIAESRQTVELFDRVILSSLKKNPAGLTMKELIDAIANAVGEWPPESWRLAMFPTKGHLDRLEKRGKIRRVEGTRPVRWEIA
ncbi:MAG TPA: MBL fold metallo-hydrolase [Terriglobia bacterium]|nr:MBL fold metallo-hydrolase [Terriglobia bacterium]